MFSSDESDDAIFITQNSFSGRLAEPNFDFDSSVFAEEKNETSQPALEDISIQQISQRSAADDDETELTEQTSRPFHQPLLQEEMTKNVAKAVPDATKYKDNWAVKLFEEWREFRNHKAKADKRIQAFPSPLERMSPEEINDALSYFVFEVKKKDDTDYPPNTVYGLVAAIQHHLRMLDKDFRFLNDERFIKLRKSLDAIMKQRAAAGLGGNTKKAQIISVGEENMLWESGFLGEANGKQLVDTMVYLFGIHFALRGGKEHRRLRFTNSQITQGTNEEGQKFLEYREDVSKTNSGGLAHRKVGGKTTRAYENSDDPTRCIVRLFNKYISLW